MKNKLFCLIWFISGHMVFAQTTFDIIFPSTSNEQKQKCQTYSQIFRHKPKEVQFRIIRERENLYFELNDKEWFNLLFENPNDGLAIDIVSKDRYNCKYETFKPSQIRGLLLKPVYAKKLKSGLRNDNKSAYRTFVGKIPQPLVNDELEFNILFLSNKVLCNYYVVSDLESYPWDLLDMGMYLDSLTYNTKEIKPAGTDGYLIKNKTLKFTIPFEKSKSQYAQEDIKPIYDSLRLTDFNIKTINIKAYSSVEGSHERNIELQEERAQSITAALQTFQKPTIKTEISSSENWVEFLNDIKDTSYKDFAGLSKNEIKTKLNSGLANELEPILKNHRKAIVELELQKKDKYKDMSEAQLVSKFNAAITEGKIDEASEIQNSIFEKLKLKEASPDLLRKMEIPKQSKFVKIFNENSAYRYMLDIRESLIVYNELLELKKIAPKNKEVRYNIMAIKIKLWRHEAIEVNDAKLKNEINALSSVGVDSALISRMLVNFHIIKAEKLMRERDYDSKDKSVTYINNNYKKFPLSDYDYLSLAQFFSYYSNTEMAVNLLEEKAKSIEINENLLFYYLNLTLVKKEITSDSNYRAIMLNAINMNKERYCKLFNSIEKGGATFQLLEDQYLRSTYCENCNSVNKN